MSQTKYPAASSRPDTEPAQATGVKAVFFDFDGTLVDSIEAARATTSDVIAEVGVAELSLSDLLYAMRFDTYNRMAHHTGISDPQTLSGLTRVFFEQFIRYPERVEPQNDAIEACRTLRGCGIKLGIVSNNRSDMIRRVLEYHSTRWPDLLDLFPIILGEDSVDPPKPDPKGLRLAMEIAGVHASETIYIGDGPSDAIAAKAAGIRAIGVGWVHDKYGTASPSEFDEMIGSVRELPAYLDNGMTR